jgi:hypothetical protein
MLMLAVMLGTALTFHTEDPEAETPILPPNTYLVKARAVRVDAKTLVADFVVERVYVGDSALKGQKFALTNYLPQGGSHMGKTLYSERVEGEVGLWWVGRKDSSPDQGKTEMKLFTYNDLGHELPSVYYPFPAVLKGGLDPSEVISPRYGDLKTDPHEFAPKLMLEWAEAIEKVYNTKGDDARIALLKKYVGSDNPPISAWALDTLSRFLEPGTLRQFRMGEGKHRADSEWQLRNNDLVKQVRKDVKLMLLDYADDPKLPIYAQAELDIALTRIDDDWPKSDRRAKMFQRWEKVKDPVDRYFVDARLKRVKQDASK